MEQCSIFRNSAVRLCRRLCVPTFTSAPPAPLARTLLPPSQLRFSRHKVFAGAGGTSFFKGIGDMLTNKSDNDNKKGVEFYPHIVKAGDPVLHEPAQDVPVGDISSDRIQTVIDDMIRAMRKAPGVGLAAPQIAVPLKIIVLEDTKEYISYAAKNEVEAQDRRPFDLLVVLNPKLKAKSKRKALFFEGCLSVDGYRALVERHLEVEVTGFDRYGHPIKINATGWQARILQHECDHLDGTIYVDRMLPRTFRTVENLILPLPAGCPKLGIR